MFNVTIFEINAMNVFKIWNCRVARFTVLYTRNEKHGLLFGILSNTLRIWVFPFLILFESYGYLSARHFDIPNQPTGFIIQRGNIKEISSARLGSGGIPIYPITPVFGAQLYRPSGVWHDIGILELKYLFHTHMCSSLRFLFKAGGHKNGVTGKSS